MANKKLCSECRNEEREEDNTLGSDCRMKKEIQAVVECMRADFPLAFDFSTIEGADEEDQAYCEIIDKNDKRIGVISERQLTEYWNRMEGVYSFRV